MLSKKEQIVLLELLFHRKLDRNWFLKNTECFSNSSDFFKKMARLKKWGLVFNNGMNINKNNPKSWQLTFKGQIRAKLIALDQNNPKDYSKNLKSEFIEFEYTP